jgi:CxxC-x17-CxxC domain-containing protein
MAFEDRALTCVDCGNGFVFSAGEQEFHASKGFTNEPKRCLACRQARRASRADAPTTAGNSPATATDGARPPRPNRRERRADGSEESVPAQRSFASPQAEGARTFTAICSACKGEAVLNFEPVGNRAVLCSSCYDKIYAPAARA